MTRIDQIIADSLAGSPETHVAILAREVVRLREAPAVVVPDVNEIAQEIRRIDGKHDKGAGVIAEELRDWLLRHLCIIPADRVLGEGVVALRRFAERCAQRDHQPDEHIGCAKCVACEAEDALRANQGGGDDVSGKPEWKSDAPTPGRAGEGGAWVPPVEARAVVVPPDSPSKYRWRSVLDMIPKDAWLICIDTDARIFYAKQGPRSGGWTFHGAHAFRDPTHWLDVIPENRLLRDGMVQVPERELACMRAELEYRRAASEEAPESVLDPLWDAFDALRANQGGANHD